MKDMVVEEEPEETEEVEAELLLWGEDADLARVLAPGALYCVLNAEPLTPGSAERGGAPTNTRMCAGRRTRCRSKVRTTAGPSSAAVALAAA